jgi:PAS domain S-box-containing protein
MKTDNIIGNILIVDDMPDNLLLLTQVLSKKGYHIRAAKTAKEALASVKANPPDLVLLDIKLPDLSGFDVCKQLKADESTMEVPVIFLSALGAIVDKLKGFEVGGVDYITKPFQTEELVIRVKTHLELSLVRKQFENLAVELKLSNEKLISESEERKKYEKALQESEESLSTTLYSIGDGVIATDINGCVTRMNRTAEALTGWNFLEAKNKQLSEIYKIINAATRNVVDNPVKRVIDKGEIVGLTNHTVLISRDGTEYQIADSAAPIRDHQGNIRGVILVFSNVTEKYKVKEKSKKSLEDLEKGKLAALNLLEDLKLEIDERIKTESALRESETKYRRLVENALTGIYTSDFSGKLLLANQALCDMLEYDNIDEILNINLQTTYKNPEDRKQILSLLKKDTRINNHEIELVTKKGNLRNVMLSAYMSGDLITGMIIDISDLKRTENELVIAKDKAEKASHLKSTLLKNINHEFRTPMNSILGFSDILMSCIEDQESLGMVSNINISGKRLMDTLNAIIDFAEIESGSLPLNFTEFTLNEILKPIANKYKLLAHSKNLEFEINVGNETKVCGNKHLLTRVLENILDNSIKFTKDGKVEIMAFEQGTGEDYHVVMEVKDTGIGIDDKHHRLIFEPFKQLSEGFSREFEGTGLGLTIAKRYFEHMGGTIEIKSRVNSGTSIILKFPHNWRKHPLVPCEPSASFVPPEVSTSTPPAKSPTTRLVITGSPGRDSEGSTTPDILLVEDNMLNITLTKMYLRKCCKLEYALDGNTAIQLVSQKQYDLILMDINLGPGIDGIETTQEIRKIRGYENIPIIALTGYTSEEDQERIFAGGCTHYMSKPFEQKDLLDLINIALGH